MRLFFTTTLERYKGILHDPGFLSSLIVGWVLLLGTLIFNYFAVIYTTERASSAVGDIILSNIPVFDVDWIFVFGPITFTLFILGVSLCYPKTVPFAIKSIALFVLTRSIFITLTHIGPFPNHVVIDGDTAAFLNIFSSNPNSFLFSIFSTGADLFFSGHTGLPFMLAFVFWDKWFVRMICFITSIFFGITVLMGHLHYSIDVASAFFISYTIYVMATHLFKKDRLVSQGALMRRT